MHIGDQWMQLHSRDKALNQAFARPFPVGVEYYRPPVPPPEYWAEDFRRISTAGMSIVRVWYSWDWVDTLPNHYEFDDHGLKVWVDTPLGTHMACPAWMLRSHPDMRVVRRDGRVQQNTTGAFAAHGAMIHNFDHPMWRVYVEHYLRQFVPRYKDHQALGVWGTWDGIGYAGAWTANPDQGRCRGHVLAVPTRVHDLRSTRTQYSCTRRRADRATSRGNRDHRPDRPHRRPPAAGHSTRRCGHCLQWTKRRRI